MSQQSRLFLLLVSVALLAIAWINWPSDSTANEELLGGESESAPPVSTALADPVAEEVEQAGERVEADEAPRERWVRVVNEDGAPVAGAQVFPRLESEVSEEVRAHIVGAAAAETPIEYRMPFRHSSVTPTDQDGYAPLPTQGLGTVLASHEAAEGAAWVTDAPAPRSDPVLLTLHRFDGFPVRVVTPSGEPVAGVQVRVRDAPQEQRDEFSRLHARSGVDDPRRTDAQGRAWLRSRFDVDQLKNAGIDPEQFSPSVEVTLPCQERLQVRFEEGRSEELQIITSEMGSVRIRLRGYPLGVEPVLYPVMEDRRMRGENAESLGPDAEGWHHFDFIPVGAALQVRFALIQRQASGYSSNSTQIQPMTLAGPAFAGDVVEAEYTRDLTGMMVGRALDEAGQPIIPRGSGGESLELRMRFRDDPWRTVAASLEPGLDGQFVVDFGRVGVGDTEAADYTELILAFQGMGPMRGTWIDPQRRWKKLAMPEPNAEGVIDLGDVVLGQDQPLLSIRAVNASGEGVPGATARFEVECVLDDGSVQWRHISSQLTPRTTERDGSLIVPGFDFDHQFQRPLPPAAGRLTGKLRVQLQHQEYLPAERIFDRHDTQFELVLPQAAVVQGEARVYKDLLNVEVLAVPAGTPPEAWGTQRRPRAQLWPQSDEARVEADFAVVPFELKPLAEGEYDLVFRLMDTRQIIPHRETIRVAGPTTLPSLIDLTPQIHRYAITVLGLDGKPLTDADGKVQDVMYRGWRADSDRGLFGRGPVIEQDRAVFFSPRDQPLNGWITSRDARPYALEGVAPGESSIQLETGSFQLVLRAVHGHELPEGWAIELDLHSGQMPTPAKLLEGNPSDGLRIELASSGGMSLTWKLVDESGGWRGVAQSQAWISEAMLRGGGVLELEPPAKLFESPKRG